MERVLERKIEAERPGIMLFDVLDEERLRNAGALIWREAVKGQLFAAGSSGVEYALTSHWRETGLVNQESGWMKSSGPVDRLLVVSGSCSPVTKEQIEYALEHGFADLKLPVDRIIEPEQSEQAVQEVLAQAEALFSEGKSVIIYSALGPEDESITTIKEKLSASGRNATDTGKLIGQKLGGICKDIIQNVGLRRVVVAGGDTSGYVLKELEIYGLECVMKVAPGGPLCRSYSDNPLFDGVELLLKGGQVGDKYLFETVKNG
jgi:uncharacterized protein YgbK (DUF1537 family)